MFEGELLGGADALAEDAAEEGGDLDGEGELCVQWVFEMQLGRAGVSIPLLQVCV